MTHTNTDHEAKYDEWFDQLIRRIIRKREARWKRQLPKWLRPQCGAKTRAGGRCRATAVWDKETNSPINGRCRMHGGLSTGPKTEEGKKRALANLKQFQD